MSERICNCCGKSFDESELRKTHDGDMVCQRCIDNHYITCGYCGELCKAEDAKNLFNGDSVCESCYIDHCFTCPDCGEIFYDNEPHDWVGPGYYDNRVCDRCFTEYSRCDVCGDYYRTSSMRGIENVDGFAIDACESCVYDNDDIVRCDACGDLYYDPERTGGGFCAYCREDQDDLIQNYGYKPDPDFYPEYHPHTVYMGVELEVDGISGKARHRHDATCRVKEIMDGLVYMKEDGSLHESGFEIVSHPCTMEYHLNEIGNKWKALMEACKEEGFYSHDAKTCGLHVHVSLEPLERKDPGIVGKLLYVMDKYWDNIVNFSRRTQGQLDRYAKRYSCKAPVNQTLSISEKSRAKGERNRFFAINLQNTHTIEFRVFRGTLNYTTFAATLQFIQVILDKLTSITYRKLQVVSWAELTHSDHQELNEYLRSRNLYQEFVPDSEDEADEPDPETIYYTLDKNCGYYPFGDDKEHSCVIVEFADDNIAMVAFDEVHDGLHNGCGSSDIQCCLYVLKNDLIPMSNE